MYKKQFEQIRKMDNSRPLTTANCHFFEEKTFDLVDIVSLNLYSGWYTSNDVSEYYQKYFSWIEKNGGAAIYGFREPTRVKWSEERQSDILDESLSFYLNRTEIIGTLIWQFCDCRVTEENNWFQTRARKKNNKGIFDKYRRPKLSHEIVKKHF